MSQLDDVKRATLVAYYVEECSVLEIAAREGKSVSAVKMELLRGRRKLREIVEKLEEGDRMRRQGDQRMQ